MKVTALTELCSYASYATRTLALLGAVALVASCGKPMRASFTDGGGASDTAGGGGSDGVVDSNNFVPDGSQPALPDAAFDVGNMAETCSVPSVGAACTPDQVPCGTCCTDHWSCSNGTWQNQWLGCLPTTFSCGDKSCNETTDCCETSLHFGGLPLPTTYRCQPLPAACNGQRCPSCDCLTQAGISFSSCVADPSGAITIIL